MLTRKINTSRALIYYRTIEHKKVSNCVSLQHVLLSLGPVSLPLPLIRPWPGCSCGSSGEQHYLFHCSNINSPPSLCFYASPLSHSPLSLSLFLLLYKRS